MLKINSYAVDLTDQSLHIQKVLNDVLSDNNLGFLSLPNHQSLISSSQDLGGHLSKNYDHLVVLGIGGSSMGPCAFAELASIDRITFFDNPDLMLTSKISRLIKSGQKIAWLIISKSGSTIEILWSIEWLVQQFSVNTELFWNHTYYITEKTKNPLTDLAEKYKRPSLEIPLNVGGRFSVLSPVGLVIAQYLGLNLSKIVSGAQTAHKDTLNVVSICNEYLNSFERNETISLFWMYSSYTRWFGGWLQQLWAESLGKKVNLKGEPAYSFSTPMVAIGACDQHSILQQVIEGPKDKFVSIFRFKSLEQGENITTIQFEQTQMLKNKKFGTLLKAEAQATRQAMQDSGVSTVELVVDQLDEEALGYLFMYFQIVVAVLARVKNINAFDQPGVQLGKTMIKNYLDE